MFKVVSFIINFLLKESDRRIKFSFHSSKVYPYDVRNFCKFVMQSL